MGEVEVTFDIPEGVGRVRCWFMQALQALAGVRRRETGRIELVLEEPRVRRLTGPDAERVGYEIVVTARRIETLPVPSDWCPEYVIERFDIQELDLGAVMAFRLFALHDETYVLASCVERPPALWSVFEEFLKQVEARYPALGPFWQTAAAQQRERMKAELRRRFDDAETAGHGEGEASPARLRGRKSADAKEINKICANWYKVQHRVTQTDFCNGKGISVSCLRRWLKGYPYPEPGPGG